MVGTSAGLLAVAWGGLALTRSPAPTDVGVLAPAKVDPSPPEPAVSAEAAVPTRNASLAEAAPVGRPVRLSIPRLRVTAPVVPVSALSTGALAVPDDPSVLGWWSGGGRPGEPQGSTVIDGHVDSHTLGLGALFQLRRLNPGDAIEVGTSLGASLHYRVVARREYPKTAFPAGQVFRADGTAQLVLVTCGGAFDASDRQYADNVIVYATPIGAAA